MTNPKFKITDLMEEAIKSGVFPSASLLVAKDAEIVFKDYFGGCDKNTVFDIASITKPVITATLTMIAVSKGLIKLSDTIGHYFPDYPHLHKITVANLLNHTSGLPWWKSYYKRVPLKDVASESGRKCFVDEVLREPLEYETGSKYAYSDPGFIVMSLILEKIFSKPLSSLADELIAKPLNLINTFYNPIQRTPWSDDNFKPAYKKTDKDLSQINFAPGENCPWRKEVTVDYVDDRNCYAMGGVSGHAGLFTDADDLHKFISELVLCYKGGGKFLNRDVVGEFIDLGSHSIISNCHNPFLYGWNMPIEKGSQAGKHFSRGSIGHLSFTGCSVWVDLKKDVWVILLANRLHPTSENQKIKDFRPAIHDLVWDVIGV